MEISQHVTTNFFNCEVVEALINFKINMLVPINLQCPSQSAHFFVDFNSNFFMAARGTLQINFKLES